MRILIFLLFLLPLSLIGQVESQFNGTLNVFSGSRIASTNTFTISGIFNSTTTSYTSSQSNTGDIVQVQSGARFYWLHIYSIASNAGGVITCNVRDSSSTLTTFPLGKWSVFRPTPNLRLPLSPDGETNASKSATFNTLALRVDEIQTAVASATNCEQTFTKASHGFRKGTPIFWNGSTYIRPTADSLVPDFVVVDSLTANTFKVANCGTYTTSLANGLYWFTSASPGYSLTADTTKVPLFQALNGKLILNPIVGFNLMSGGGSGDVTRDELADSTAAIRADISSAGITALTGDVTASGTGSVVVTVANNAITSAKIASQTVDSLDIKNAAITTVKIKDDNITTGKVLDGTLLNADLAPQTVDSNKIKNRVITTVKLEDNAVTSAKVASQTIDSLDLKNRSITTVKIADDAVTAAKIGAGEVGASELASTSVVAGSYTNSSITVDADGRITVANNGSSGGSTTIVFQSSAPSDTVVIWANSTTATQSTSYKAYKYLKGKWMHNFWYETIGKTLTTAEPIVIGATGQSNMEGNATGGDTTRDARVLALNNATNTWQVAVIGQAPFRTGALYNNIAFNFAKKLAQEENRVVKIVIVAQGSQPIEQWSNTTAPLFDSLAKKLRLYTSNVKAILWHQGESNNDAVTLYCNSDPCYEQKLNTVIGKFDTIRAMSEDWKFIAGGMSDVLVAVNNTRNGVLENLDNDIYGNTLFTSGVGIGVGVDNTHFTAQGLIDFGIRYYYRYKDGRDFGQKNVSYSVGATQDYTQYYNEDFQTADTLLPIGTDFTSMAYVKTSNSSKRLTMESAVNQWYGSAIAINKDSVGLTGSTAIKFTIRETAATNAGVTLRMRINQGYLLAINGSNGTTATVFLFRINDGNLTSVGSAGGTPFLYNTDYLYGMQISNDSVNVYRHDGTSYVRIITHAPGAGTVQFSPGQVGFWVQDADVNNRRALIDDVIISNTINSAAIKTYNFDSYADAANIDGGLIRPYDASSYISDVSGDKYLSFRTRVWKSAPNFFTALNDPGTNNRCVRFSYTPTASNVVGGIAIKLKEGQTVYSVYMYGPTGPSYPDKIAIFNSTLNTPLSFFDYSFPANTTKHLAVCAIADTIEIFESVSGNYYSNLYSTVITGLSALNGNVGSYLPPMGLVIKVFYDNVIVQSGLDNINDYDLMFQQAGNLVSVARNKVVVIDLPVYKGTGTPEGSVTAPVGSIYLRTDGGTGTTFYVKESGTGNTGWVASVSQLKGSATLDFPSTSTLSQSDLTITVTGASDGDIVDIGVVNALSSVTGVRYRAWVSSANTVTVRFNNDTVGSVDPASAIFKVTVTK